MKPKKGISLIVLIVTIIVIIVLAGAIIISLNSSGIINTANNTAISTDIVKEVESLGISASQALLINNSANVTKENLQQALNQNLGEDKAEVIDCSRYLVVKFKKSNRQYQMDLDGKTLGPLEIKKYDYAGDLSKNKQYDGTEGKAYKITCIEDLVEWSNNASKYTGIIELTQDLDFLSLASYNDYTTTVYGDLNKDGTVSPLIAELTDEKAIGFTPISILNGTFDGNEHEIRNIYINRTSNAALILGVNNNAVIKNFGVTGQVKSTTSAAGMVAFINGQTCTISNCYNICKIKGGGYAGGICAQTEGANLIIENTYNSGIITSNGSSGGVVGGNSHKTTVNIKNSYNIGKIMGEKAGGIAGGDYLGSYSLYNCYNSGSVSGVNVGGIIGKGRMCALDNLYNTGIIQNLGSIAPAGIVGWDFNRLTTAKCYYLDNVKLARATGNWGGGTWPEVGNSRTSEYLKSTEFLKLLNDEVKLHDGWAYWKSGENGYPILDLDNINEIVVEESE